MCPNLGSVLSHGHPWLAILRIPGWYSSSFVGKCWLYYNCISDFFIYASLWVQSGPTTEDPLWLQEETPVQAVCYHRSHSDGHLISGLPLGLYLFLLYWFGVHLHYPFCHIYQVTAVLSCVNSSANPIIYFFVGSFRHRLKHQTLKMVLQNALQETPETTENMVEMSRSKAEPWWRASAWTSEVALEWALPCCTWPLSTLLSAYWLNMPQWSTNIFNSSPLI